MPSELVLQSLRHVWLAIAPLNVPVAVIGGLALAAWKHVRATRDIDLLVGVGVDQADLVLQRLVAVGIRPKRSPACTTLGQLELMQLVYEPPDALMDIQVDLLLADSPYHRTALERRVVMTLPDVGVDVAVLACEDLVLHKLLAGRMIDLADAVALLHSNRETLDLEYLSVWAGRLKLEEDLARVWAEAGLAKR